MTCYCYIRKLDTENAKIAKSLVQLTETYCNWGFGLCFLHMRNVKQKCRSHKRVYRIYCDIELNLRIKPKKRLARETPAPLAVPQEKNET
ncbi:MAG: hypothetical protein RL571_2926 [Pseudomonadota bacterium]|jgi:putative transposase